MTNDGLVGFRKVGGAQGVQLVPDLAVSLPAPTDGGKTYTFQVRPGIRYSNGTARSAGRLPAGDRARRSSSARRVRRTTQDRRGRSLCEGQGAAISLAASSPTARLARSRSHLAAPDGDFLTKLALPVRIRGARATRPATIETRPARCPQPGRTGSPSTTRRRRRIGSFGTRTSASGRPTRSREGFPDSITFSGQFGGLDSVRYVRSHAGRADITCSAEGLRCRRRARTARRPLPEPASHLNTAFTTDYFFLNTRAAAVRRRPRTSRGRLRIRLRGVSSIRRVASFAADVPDPPSELPGLPADLPVRRSRRRWSPRVEHGSWCEPQVRAGSRVTVWVPAPFASTRSLHGLHSRARSASARAVRVVRLDPGTGAPPTSTRSATPAQEPRSASDGWTADYPSAAGFIPPHPQLRRVHPGVAGTNQNFAAVLRSRRSTRRWHARPRCRRRIPLQRRCSGRRSSAISSPRRQSCRRRTDATSTSSPSDVGNYQYNPQWGVLLSQLWVK